MTDYAKQHKAADRLCAKLGKLESMTASELRQFEEKLQAESSFVIRELINAGFGMEKGQDTRNRAATTNDPLATLYVKVTDTANKAYAERSARLRYQGNTRPIKRATW